MRFVRQLRLLNVAIRIDVNLRGVRGETPPKYLYYLTAVGGPGSSVGIATDYRLDGPRSNPGGDDIFSPSRPALVPTRPLVK